MAPCFPHVVYRAFSIPSIRLAEAQLLEALTVVFELFPSENMTAAFFVEPREPAKG